MSCGIEATSPSSRALQRLTGPIAGPLRRAHRTGAQLAQARLHQPQRARVAVVSAENLHQPRRLICGHSSSSRRNTGSSGSNCEPAGARRYRDGSALAASRATSAD
jgi:hypothetical protein